MSLEDVRAAVQRAMASDRDHWEELRNFEQIEQAVAQADSFSALCAALR
jgi:hypothetical protein